MVCGQDDWVLRPFNRTYGSASATRSVLRDFSKWSVVPTPLGQSSLSEAGLQLRERVVQ